MGRAHGFRKRARNATYAHLEKKITLLEELVELLEERDAEQKKLIALYEKQEEE